MEKKHLRELIKLEKSKDSIISVWTALVLIQVNIAAHRLLRIKPPLVLREEMDQRPNTSRPTLVKGGSIQRRSVGDQPSFVFG